MRVAWLSALVVAVMVVAIGGGANAQLNIGPGGLSGPPINVLAIFKFLRNLWNAYMYPPTATPVLAASRTEPLPQENTEEVEEATVPESTEDLQRTDPLVVQGFDTQGNIVEKFDYGCTEDESGACVQVDTSDFEAEDKDGTAQLVVGKWPLIYVTLITVLFWWFVILATPYIITGETYARREDEVSSNGIVDQQDVLLLLSWLLGEASNDRSCLERIVCLTPTKSSKYISVSSMVLKVASFFQSWVPYNPLYEDILLDLEDVTLDGFSQSCHDYYCPTIPEL